jgi:hypothetical protein
VRPAGSPLPFSGAHPFHLFEDGPIMSVGLASRIEDLVGRRQIALEAYRTARHQVTCIRLQVSTRRSEDGGRPEAEFFLKPDT